MRRIAFFVLLIIVVGAGSLAAQCPLAPAASVDEVEAGIVALVNEERQAAGLAPLGVDLDLQAAARQYAAGQFSGPAGELPDLAHLRSNAWTLDFNGATPRLTRDTARDQVRYWRGDLSWADNALRPEARETGAGVAISGDTVYFVQVFDVLHVAGGDGGVIELYENPQAVDPSWAALKAFLLADKTDEIPYVKDVFICGDFAEVLHNNAERAGIKTAYVLVAFPSGPGHALSAFVVDGQTVYIDAISGDKVIYLEEGRLFGAISLDAAREFTYSYFETYAERVYAYLDALAAYEGRVAAYDAELQLFNQAVAAYNADPTQEEYDRLTVWQAQLDADRAGLQATQAQLDAESDAVGLSGPYFDPYNVLVDTPDPTVVSLYVHW